jgi:hypothetical protein
MEYKTHLIIVLVNIVNLHPHCLKWKLFNNKIKEINNKRMNNIII